MHKALAYAKAHWKEFLALGLAAIPAAFILFHKGAQQAAAGAITYIPSTFGGGSDPSATIDPTAAAAAQANTVAPAPAPAPRPGPQGIPAGMANGKAGGLPGKIVSVVTKGFAQPPAPRTSVGGNTGTLVPGPKKRIRGIIGTGGGPNTTGRSSGTKIL